MRLLLGCGLGHLLLAEALARPWWVPELTLVALVLAVARAPRQWFSLSLAAGFLAVVWAIRFPLPLLMIYVGVGAWIRWLSFRFDVLDERVQYLLCVLVVCGITFGSLWLEGLWSFSLLGQAAIHVMVSMLAVPLLRRLAQSP